MSNTKNEPAVVADVISLIGNKWAMMAIFALKAGPLRFSELRQTVCGVSSRSLTITLRRLGQCGLVSRTQYPEVPLRVEYALTPLGCSLAKPIADIIEWLVEHHEELLSHSADIADASDEVRRRTDYSSLKRNPKGRLQ